MDAPELRLLIAAAGPFLAALIARLIRRAESARNYLPFGRRGA